MHFEKALNNFIAEIKQYYGYEPKIKSMELSEDLYRRLEFELREKSLWQPETPQPRVIQFYSHGDMIRLHKAKQQPEKPKRYIDRVMFEGKQTYAISNDGRLYHLVREDVRWVEYPNLPQD